MSERDTAAEALIKQHFALDEDATAIIRLLVDTEEDPSEPVKLIEATSSTVETGHVTFFGFAPWGDFRYPLAIAQVTPAELEKIADGSIVLPDGWSLAHSIAYDRKGL